jgi:hypothetical protein
MSDTKLHKKSESRFFYAVCTVLVKMVETLRSTRSLPDE